MSAASYDIIGAIDLEGSVNSLSLGASSNMLLCGETNGLIAIIEIGTANSKQPMRKKSE